MKKIYFIGIGGIWVSALARYYLSEWYQVHGSDSTDSELISKLKSEWCNIIIWSDNSRIDSDYELIIHTEAIPGSHPELLRAQELSVKTLKYSEALWEIANNYKLISVAGTHGKSTTTSLIAQVLLASSEDFCAVVWTILEEFWGKNYYKQGDKKWYFLLEACEYKKHFLAYKPLVWAIANIEYDHADYFKTQEEYIQAFEEFMENIRPWGFCILWEDTYSTSLIGKRLDIHYIQLKWKYFIYNSEQFPIPDFEMKVPGEHILYDARLAYIVSHLIWVNEINAVSALENYSGVWRRMEIIWETKYGNILMSDYGHHPTEIQITLEALKKWYPDKKLFVIFQPHQYSRTLELLEWFQNCFTDADRVIITNIYASRDSESDKQKISAESLVTKIKHSNIRYWNGLENTLKHIQDYDSNNPNSSIILLQWAWDIDNLRYMISTKKAL